jgi:phosphoribosylformylglycinamidine synthase
MKENESVLYSQYIIDGIRCSATPAELLEECMNYDEPQDMPAHTFDDIIDESTEPPLSDRTYDMGSYNEYISLITPLANADRPFRMLYPDHFTRLQIAKALLSRLWSEGHFRLGDLRIWAQWEWNTRPIGNMAAFYESVRSAGEYIYGLGTYIEDYIFMESDHASNVKFFAWLPETAMTEDEPDEEREDILFKSSPYESTHPWITEIRKCPPTMQNDPDSWIIYIPFDTCRFKTGGSLLTQAHDDNGGAAPNIMDPDYFIDCYEVVRELTEDGIIMAGVTVADGGLLTAAARMCGGLGCDLDISRLSASYQEEDTTKVLFGEVPGVLIQISEDNYDYVDSQLILQDVAYFPVGHPSAEHTGVKVSKTEKNGIAGILASLLSQTSEGED